MESDASTIDIDDSYWAENPDEVRRVPEYRMLAEDAVRYFGWTGKYDKSAGVYGLAARVRVHPQTVRRWLRETWIDDAVSLRLYVWTSGRIKIYVHPD